jgi:hypothetical protein
VANTYQTISKHTDKLSFIYHAMLFKSCLMSYVKQTDR